jgi:hypothetical protein
LTVFNFTLFTKSDSVYAFLNLIGVSTEIIHADFLSLIKSIRYVDEAISIDTHLAFADIATTTESTVLNFFIAGSLFISIVNICGACGNICVKIGYSSNLVFIHLKWTWVYRTMKK